MGTLGSHVAAWLWKPLELVGGGTQCVVLPADLSSLIHLAIPSLGLGYRDEWLFQCKLHPIIICPNIEKSLEHKRARVYAFISLV